MKRDKKKNLKAAFDELNAPDKAELLRKIESKKAFGGDFQREFNEFEKPRAVGKRRGVIALACTLVIVAICAISGSILFRKSDSGEETYLKGNYRNSWNFNVNYYISFSDVEISMTDFCEQKAIDGILPDLEGWKLLKSQITQGESAFRQVYSKDGREMEVSIFTDSNLVGYEKKYKQFLSYNTQSEYSDTIVYTGEYSQDGQMSDVYVVYEKNAVYFICITNSADAKI